MHCIFDRIENCGWLVGSVVSASRQVLRGLHRSRGSPVMTGFTLSATWETITKLYCRSTGGAERRAWERRRDKRGAKDVWLDMIKSCSSHNKERKKIKSGKGRDETYMTVDWHVKHMTLIHL